MYRGAERVQGREVASSAAALRAVSMWYTTAMQTRAECNCGWGLDLSDFYAGKQIRCPQCERVLQIPGESTTRLYDSRLPLRQACDGRWVPVQYTAPRRCCGGGFLVLVIVAASLIGLLNQCSRGRPEMPDQRMRPSEKSTPAEPGAEKEDEF